MMITKLTNIVSFCAHLESTRFQATVDCTNYPTDHVTLVYYLGME